MIEVMELTKRYGKKRGVEDIAFSIQKGEIIGLLGPNGAGKSTIMKMLTGYHAPTSGSILINGIDALESSREASALIGFMAEIPPLYVDMGVEQFLLFVAGIKGIERPKRKQDVERVMNLAGICQVSHRLIRNLSKGYRQRVGLAQALIGEPEILILDEPTAGLDPKQIAEVRNMLLSLKGKHTMIVSSHILSEISQICDRVIIMKEGRIVAVDTLDALMQQKRSSAEFFLTVKGELKKIRSHIEEMEGIHAVDVLEDGETAGYHRFAVKSDGKMATRERLSLSLAQEKWPVVEMRSNSYSLEQAFLELTQGEEREGVK